MVRKRIWRLKNQTLHRIESRAGSPLGKDMISHPGMHSHIDLSPHSWSAGPTVESDIYSSGGNPNSFLGQPPPLFRASLAGKRDDPARIDNPVPGDIKARRERVERVPVPRELPVDEAIDRAHRPNGVRNHRHGGTLKRRKGRPLGAGGGNRKEKAQDNAHDGSSW